MIQQEVEIINKLGGIAPAVGFAGEESDSFPSSGRASERGEVCGQGRERNLIDHAVAFVIPGKTVESCEQNDCVN